jgi:hypothetical protein
MCPVSVFAKHTNADVPTRIADGGCGDPTPRYARNVALRGRNALGGRLLVISFAPSMARPTRNMGTMVQGGVL